MRTKLYDYQEKTSNDIFKRMSCGKITGAYLGFETGTRKNSYFIISSRTII